MSSVTRLTAADVVAAVRELPPLPASITEVARACDDQDITVGRLSQIILRDQALTANILKLANSACDGHARRVTTITGAVVLLGFSAVKSLAISGHTSRLLGGALPGDGPGPGELWTHSQAVAFTARRLAVEVHLAPVEEAFVAGLLHDVGKTILATHMARVFDEIARAAEEQRLPLHEVEAELLGFDHAELGARAAAAWNLPPELEEAIRHHHSPGRAQVKPALAHCVHLADACCTTMGAGLGPDGLAHGVDPASLETLGIAPERVVRLMEEAQPLIADPLAVA